MGIRKDRNMPKTVFIGPEIYRTRFTHVLMVVDKFDRHGRPQKVTIIDEDETINLKGNERCITGYVPADVMKDKYGRYA